MYLELFSKVLLQAAHVAVVSSVWPEVCLGFAPALHSERGEEEK